MGAVSLDGCGLILEVVEEGGDAFEGGFALAFDFDGELDFGLADAAEVLDVVQLGGQSHAAAGDDGLSKAHVGHAVVDEHLDVVHLDDLIPHVRQQRQREIAVGDGRLVGAFTLCALHVDMNPLVVQGGVGKHVDALLVDQQPVGMS